MDKKDARKAGLLARHTLSAQQRQMLSRQIAERAIAMIAPYQTIGCYVSMRDEVDTGEILDWCFCHGRTVAVPKVHGSTLDFYAIQSRTQLAPGVFGVLEPISGKVLPVQEIEIMLVPLSSFDRQGHRTGYGKGFYDSVLRQCRLSVGLAFPSQMVESFEPDPWDISLDRVITGKETVFSFSKV